MCACVIQSCSSRTRNTSKQITVVPRAVPSTRSTGLMDCLFRVIFMNRNYGYVECFLSSGLDIQIISFVSPMFGVHYSGRCCNYIC